MKNLFYILLGPLLTIYLVGCASLKGSVSVNSKTNTEIKKVVNSDSVAKVLTEENAELKLLLAEVNGELESLR